jgi:hypothetical protein
MCQISNLFLALYQAFAKPAMRFWLRRILLAEIWKLRWYLLRNLIVCTIQTIIVFSAEVQLFALRMLFNRACD